MATNDHSFLIERKRMLILSIDARSKPNGWPQFGQMHPQKLELFHKLLGADHSDARASPYELEHDGEVIKAAESNVTEPHTNMNSIQLNNAFFASFFEHPFSFFSFSNQAFAY